MPVECVVCVGDNGGGGGSEVRRGHEGEGGVEGCEGVDGVERRAVWAAHEVEGEDGVEAMEGDENVSLQSAVGGSGSIGGIKKKRPQRRAKGAMNRIGSDSWRNSMHGAGPRCRVVRYCPLGCESGPECARATGPADHEHLGRSPAFSPPIPPPSLSLLDAGRSRADFLFVVRVALIGRDRPLLLTYFFSEGT